MGSPKGPRSTSASLGRYLLERLAEMGWEGEDIHIQKAVRSPEGTEGLLAAFDSADLVILSFPTYFDSVPAAVVRAMEALALRKGGKRTPFMAIANCGFPEAGHNLTSLEVCRLFARDAGLEWRGGLAMGGGPAIGGRSLTEAGGVARNARKALELTASSLAEGGEVPSEAKQTISKPAVPAWLYAMMANRGWKRQAAASGSLKRVRDTPYEVKR